jgi:hypothetical protein
MSLFEREKLAADLLERLGEGFEVEELEEGGLAVFNDAEGIDLDVVQEEEGAVVAFEISVVVPRTTWEEADKEALEMECVEALEELFENDFGEGYDLHEEGRWSDGWSEDLDPDKDASDVLFFSLLVTTPVADADELAEVIEDVAESDLWIVSE